MMPGLDGYLHSPACHDMQRQRSFTPHMHIIHVDFSSSCSHLILQEEV